MQPFMHKCILMACWFLKAVHKSNVHQAWQATHVVLVVSCRMADVAKNNVYHDFGPVVTDWLRLANSRPVEVENPIERRYPGTGFDVAAQERVAVADECWAREALDDWCVSITHADSDSCTVHTSGAVVQNG